MKAFFYNFVTKLLHLSFFSLVQISNYCCICLFSIVPDFTHTFFFPLCFILNSFHCYVFYFINVFFQSVYSHGILSQYIFILKYICFHILEFDLGNYISSMSLHNFFNIWNIVIMSTWVSLSDNSDIFVQYMIVVLRFALSYACFRLCFWYIL